MAILNSVIRSKIFEEFSDEECDRYFSLKAKKTLYHIDTLYYSVTLEEEKVLDGNFDCPEVLRLVSALRSAKETKQAYPDRDVTFCGLSVEFASYEFYQFCLRENEMFDIFIAAALPNYDTPRIVVQLRTRALVLFGPEEAIRQSYDKVQAICDEYYLAIKEVKENRIDYAFHTNSIQTPDTFFDDENLKKHLRSNMRDGVKHFNPQTWEYNHFALGNRRSNNIYCRVYNKSKEVVEMAYKDFFIPRWKEAGLISEYDAWCLDYAYQRASYNVGVNVARINWYLEFGKDKTIKSFLIDLLRKYDIKSSNVKQIKKLVNATAVKITEEEFLDEIEGEINKLLPPVTIVLNFEYQTKRAFYKTVNIDQMLNGISVDCPYMLDRLYRVLACQKAVTNYLTDPTGSMCFLKDRKMKIDYKKYYEDPSIYLQDFWYRIKCTEREGLDLPLIRAYSKNTNIEKLKARILGSMASLSMILHEDADGDHDFVEDLSDLICTLNDNDVQHFKKIAADFDFSNEQYNKIRQRKKRMMKNRV